MAATSAVDLLDFAARTLHQARGVAVAVQRALAIASSFNFQREQAMREGPCGYASTMASQIKGAGAQKLRGGFPSEPS